MNEGMPNPELQKDLFQQANQIKDVYTKLLQEFHPLRVVVRGVLGDPDKQGVESDPLNVLKELKEKARETIVFLEGDLQKVGLALVSDALEKEWDEDAEIKPRLFVEDAEKYAEFISKVANSSKDEESKQELLGFFFKQQVDTIKAHIDDPEYLLEEIISLINISRELHPALLPQDYQRLAIYAKRKILVEGVKSMQLDHGFMLVGCGDINQERIEVQKQNLLAFIETLDRSKEEVKKFVIELLNRFIQRLNSNEESWASWGYTPDEDFTRPVLEKAREVTTELNTLLLELENSI